MDKRPAVTMIAAERGAHALQLARQCHPSLVLLDVNLPDMPGTEVLRALKADPATNHIPVVLLSADATRARTRNLDGMTVLRQLTKPVRLRQLLGLLDSTLGSEAPGKR